MNQLDLHTPVGQCVAEHPQVSRVFEALQIDYCCRGGISLEEACRARQLDGNEVLCRILAAIEAGGTEDATDWTQVPLSALCDHIEQTHHAYLRAELPQLAALIAKVVAVHGKSRPELPQVQETFESLRAELEPHMFKEEFVLFPAIRQLERSGAPPAFPFGTVANPIRMMELEHDQAGGGLQRLRMLTRDYDPPQGACNSYRAMLERLRQLEQDMHRHVHKENSILFPRAIELEAAVAHPEGHGEVHRLSRPS